MKKGISLTHALKRPREEDVEDERANTKKTPALDVNEASASTSTDKSVDLVYPFKPISGGGGGGGTPTTLVAQKPLEYANPNLRLLYSNPLILTNSNTLSVKVSIPLAIQEDGIVLLTDTTLAVDESKLGVKLAADSVVFDSNGLDVHVGDARIVKGSGSLKLNSDGTIKNDVLGVNLNNSGAIVNNNGLSINISSDFKITDNKLYINNPSYVSPYITFEIGDETLSNFSGQFATKKPVSTDIIGGNGAYYSFLVYSGGMVNGVIKFKLKGENFTVDVKDGFDCCLFMNFFGTLKQETNFSFLTAPTTKPANSIDKFVPKNISSVFHVVGKNSWYVSTETNTMIEFINFKPLGTSQEFNESTCGLCVVDVVENLQVIGHGIVFSLKCPVKSQATNQNNLEMTTGSLSFSYQGQE